LQVCCIWAKRPLRAFLLTRRLFGRKYTTL